MKYTDEYYADRTELRSQRLLSLYYDNMVTDGQTIVTPYKLCREIIDHIPTINTASTTVLVIANLEWVLVLRDLYNKSQNITFITPCKRKANLVRLLNPDANVLVGDMLTMELEMKFDVIVGNPPYQASAGVHTLWDKFVIKVYVVLADNGYMGMIHPPGWRNLSKMYFPVTEVIRSLDIKYLSINDVAQGIKTFGAGTRYDVYVGQKTESRGMTLLVDEKNNSDFVDLTQWAIIPNFNIDIGQYLAKDPADRVEILYRGENCYRKKNMSSTQTAEHIWPYVKHISLKDGNLSLVWSNTKSVSYGVPKVMFCAKIGEGNVYVDTAGEYGLTDATAGIVDTAENLPYIKQALDSEKFKELMSGVRFGLHYYNIHVMRLFRKDFWKDFI